MPQFYGYGRVSTAKQEISPEAQKQRVLDHYKNNFANTHEWGGWFCDEGISAARAMIARPQGKKMFTALKKGDVVCSTEMSRLFRKTADMLDITEALSAMGVRILMMDLNVDTSTPSGKFVLTVLAAVHQMEREMISERTKIAMAYMTSIGKPSTAPMGWKKLGKKKNRRFVPDTEGRKRDLYILMLKRCYRLPWGIVEKVLRSQGATTFSKYGSRRRLIAADDGWPFSTGDKQKDLGRKLYDPTLNLAYHVWQRLSLEALPQLSEVTFDRLRELVDSWKALPLPFLPRYGPPNVFWVEAAALRSDSLLLRAPSDSSSCTPQEHPLPC